MSVERFKHTMKWLGAALALTAVIFVLHRLWTQFSELPASALQAAGPGLALASLGYAGCGLFLALLWWLALRSTGFRAASFAMAAGAFLSSQLGKYLPGNVGHLAARHVLSRRHGAGHRTLVAATLLEALLLVAAAGGLAIVVIQPVNSAGLGSVFEAVWLVPVIASLVLIVGLMVARGRGWLDSELRPPRLAVELGAALGLALVFFVASSGCFLLMSTSLDAADWLQLVPWIAAAWLLGFLVPGAPGGLGIREFVLVLGLTPMVGEAQAALDALLFRVVTIGGDALMTAIGVAGLRILKLQRLG